ncbi:MAG: RHS repeat protein [Chitinophagaceae bacterium]|nr:RHS repeat protein [Chitinophagaceae bacterium]
MYQLLLKYFLSGSLLFAAVSTYAQQPSLDKIAPPTPEMAQINKFINTPVGYSTGTISVNVPIYTIQTSNFQWPISLSYHASGIRVDDISSSVGLGWILNGTGIVSRSIAGLPDEDGLMTNTIPETTTEFGNLTTTQQNTIVQLAAAGGDTEPDRFSFTFNGKSGTFYRHRTKGIILQSENNVRISMAGNPVIIDDAGNTYYFNAYESGTSRNYQTRNGIASGISEVYDGITGWYITRAVSSDLSDTLDFIYDGAYNIRQEQDTYSFNIGQEGQLYTAGTNDVYCAVGMQTPNLEKTGNQVTSSNVPILKEIRFRSGKIVFNYTPNRLDMRSGIDAIGTQDRLGSVSVFTKEGQNYILFQKDSLYHSYFTSTVPSNKNPIFGYRLKLDSVAVFDKNNVKLASPFKFRYNSRTLPYRTSPGQDFWGFYNGADGNTTLIPNRIIEWIENGNSIVYNLGSANRLPDSASMLACMLQQVVYPTGGYTNFEFEPHRYYDENLYTTSNPPPATVGVNHMLTATPGTSTNNPKLRFVVDGASQQVGVHAFFTMYYGKSDNAPYVKIKKVDLSGNFSNILTIQSSDANADRFEYSTYNLVGGAEYEIEAYVHAGSYPVNEVWSSISVAYLKPAPSGGGGSTTTGGIRMIGGLRIKTKTDYLGDGSIALKEAYYYGNEGEGIPITHTGIINREYRTVSDLYKEVTGSEGGGGLGGSCLECPPYTYRVYSDQSPYAAASISGSLVGYTSVQKIKLDQIGNTLGKEVYYYNILTDDFDVLPDDNYYPLSKDWQNGKLQKEEIYGTEQNGNLLLLQSKEHSYSNYRLDTLYNLMVLPKTSQACFTTIASHYNIFQGRRYFGRRLLSQTITLDQARRPDGSLAKIVDTIKYTYSTTSSHQNPILTKQTSSSQKVIEKRDYYPEDMISELSDDGGGIYISMVQKGLTGAPVLSRENKNGALNKETKIVYNSPYYSFIKQSAIYQKNGTAASELYKEISYLENGRVKTQRLKDNVFNTYQWGYENTYPVVEILNAQYIDPVYQDAPHSTSLTIPTGLNEATATLTTYDGTIQLTLDAHPGKTYSLEYSLAGPVVKSGTLCASSSSIPCQSNHYQSATFNDMPAGTYTLYLYYYGDDPDVFRRVSYTYPRRQVTTPASQEFFYNGFEQEPSAATATPFAGEKYFAGDYTVPFTMPNGRSYKVNYRYLDGGAWKSMTKSFTNNMTLTEGSAIDEVRVYPADAMMSTYTYKPLVGMTSQTDPSGKTIIYHYDSFGRLQTILDQDGNVLKTYDYQYQQNNNQ